MRFILFCCFFTASDAYSQIISVVSGLNYGRFYDTQIDEGHSYSTYNPQFGYTAGIEIRDISIKENYKIGFALNFQNYGGDFFATDGGLGGSTSDDGEITKNILGVEFYPLNVNLIKNLNTSLGVTFNSLVNYNLIGFHKWYYSGFPGSSGSTDLNDIEGVVKRFHWGINASVGYRFEFGKIVFEPRYIFNLGISRELAGLQSSPKSWRHVAQLCIGYNF
jgi:hypothetical protein